MASKIIYVIMTMAILNIGLIFFSCSEWDATTGACAGSLTHSDNSTIWGLISNPESVGSGFWDVLFGSGWGLLAVVGTITLGTLLVGTTIFGKNIETIVYIAMGIGLASVVYPSIKLWQILNAWGAISSPIVRSSIAIIVVSTMVITVVFTVVDWSRGRD
jgi:hypothetical protein